MPEFTLFDSHQRKKVPLKPLQGRHVRAYVCGPTVYDDAHLGHARSAITFDLLRRTLKALHYQVEMARNITDIDDKIIHKVGETGESLEALTSRYTRRYHEEMAALNVLPPELEPKATENIPAMIGLIEALIHKEGAYALPNGDVYFDSTKDPAYGSLADKLQDDGQSRIEVVQGKRNPKDFVLWKGCKGEGDICFDAPFGKGRPGWHLECSAMIKAHLAAGEGPYQIDIHAGGADLFFPHHENEAAQTRCAYGQELAKYWMHNGFVTIGGEKMSKSLGNSFFLKDALAHYDGEVLRFYLMGIHYRSDFNFNEEDLLGAKRRLDKLYRLKKRIYPTGAAKQPDKAFADKVLEALADDLNISVALAAVDAMVAQANEALDSDPKDKGLKKSVAANLLLLDTVLGIGGSDPFGYFQQGISTELKEEIAGLIRERQEAKGTKDFARADAIREKLSALGVTVMDTADGAVWEKV